MKKKTAWYLVAVLILGLALLVVSCGGGASAPTEEPAVEEPTVEEPAVEEPTVEEPAVEEPTVEEPAVEGPPNIPVGHATASCSVCHEQGIGGATKWPDNHTGFTEVICASCHQPAG